MRIAVSSQNWTTITRHAGRSRRFLVFEADGAAPPTEEARLDLAPDQTMHETPHECPHPLDEMVAVITAEAGAGFVRKMTARGVAVVFAEGLTPIEAAHRYAAGILPAVDPAQVGDCGGHAPHHHASPAS